MSSAMQELISILDLETVELNLFRGRSPQVGWQRVFGGQVIAQALIAAQRTVDPTRHVHSLHCYFMRPGDPAVPIIYEVDRIRDGGTFTTRRVVAIQHGQAIFALSASFQIDETGLDHQIPMPLNVPDPDTLLSDRDFRDKYLEASPPHIRRFFERERPFEMKPVALNHYFSKEKLEPQQNVWFKAVGDAPDDRAIQCAMLAYFSDMTLLDATLFAHGRSIFDVVPPAGQSGRMAAVYAGQPQRIRRARFCQRLNLYPVRHACRLHCAGRIDSYQGKCLKISL
jgi:acyl-CoA thioesterase II